MKHLRNLSLNLIVAEAAALADAEGLESLTLKSLADRLKVKPPSLYNHIEGLPVLRCKLAIHGLIELGRGVAEAGIGKSGEEALFAMGLAVRRFAKERPGLYAATVPAQTPEDPEAIKAVLESLKPFQIVFGSMGLQEVETIHAIRAFRSAIHGFVSIESLGGFGLAVDLEASYHWMMDGLFKGTVGVKQQVG